VWVNEATIHLASDFGAEELPLTLARDRYHEQGGRDSQRMDVSIIDMPYGWILAHDFIMRILIDNLTHNAPLVLTDIWRDVISQAIVFHTGLKRSGWNGAHPRSSLVGALQYHQLPWTALREPSALGIEVDPVSSRAVSIEISITSSSAAFLTRTDRAVEER